MTELAAALPSGDDPLIIEATQWLLRLSDEDADGEDVAQWQHWMGTSAQHRAAFEQAYAIWQLAAQLPRVPWPTDLEVAADSYDASVPISKVSRVTATRSWTTFQRSRRHFAMAAAAAIAGIGLAVFWNVRQANFLSTPIGENRSVALPDGSRVTLGGASRLQLSMDERLRSVDLQSGEAFFEVAKDPARPFVVRAGNTHITAVGTAFNVRRAADRVHVAVTDGAVRVKDIRIEAGHQTVIVGEAVSLPTPAEVPAVLARKAGKLQYTSEPLRYVVADLSRYSAVPIEIKDVSVGELLVTGTVLEADIEGWMQGLEKALPVTISFTDRRITIAAR